MFTQIGKSIAAALQVRLGATELLPAECVGVLPPLLAREPACHWLTNHFPNVMH